MTVFNTENILQRLAGNPTAAAQLDRIKSPGTNRREAVEAVLAAGKAALAENVALKNKLLAAKQKQVALLQAKARLATNNSQSMNPQPPAAPIKPQRELTGIARTAAAFAGTSTLSASTPPSGLTGHARTAAAFARK